MSHVYSFLHDICFSSVTNVPLFGLQACVGNYQIIIYITNTNVVANIYSQTKATAIFKAVSITLYSVRRIRTTITN